MRRVSRLPQRFTRLRIGWFSRAGRAGVAVTFLGRDDRNLVRQIERFTGNKVSLMEIEGLEPRRGRNRGQSPISIK